MTACRVCGANSVLEDTGLESNRYRLRMCSGCRTVIVDRSAPAEEITRLYDELFSTGGYSQHREEFERLKAGQPVANAYRAHILRRIERRVKGRRLIEIGGGTGAFGVLARSRGWQYTSWDVSRSAVESARALSLDTRWFDPAGLPPYAPESADAVVMWEVIEHVWDVRSHLIAARRALGPGGIFVASTPNFMRKEYRASLAAGPNQSSPPIHVNFFTAESLAFALRSAGFRAVRVVPRRLYRPAPTPRSIAQHALIALGMLEAKTLVCFAQS
jgi:2-polyprenyl-3-methyl-5-hydroxy-6-metoxy-1,4-benzoquinol methylase